MYLNDKPDPRMMPDDAWAEYCKEEQAKLNQEAAEQEAMAQAFMSDLRFEIMPDDVLSDRNPEDGEPRQVSCFIVRAEAPNGERWVYTFARFCGPTKYEDVDGQGDWFVLVPRDGEYKSDAAAEAAANLLVARINKAVVDGKMLDLNPAYWMKGSPCYGSAAWTQEDENGLMDDDERAFHGC
mgnify:CR=1 FL=1